MLTYALDTIIAAIPGPVFVKGVDGRYVIANDAAAQSLGYGAGAEMLNKTDLELRPDMPEEAGLARERDREVMQSGQPLIREVHHTMRSGETRWYLSSKAPLRKDGVVVGVIGLANDITAQKQAEAKAREGEAMKTRFIESASHDLRQPLQAMFLTASGLARLVGEDGRALMTQLETGLHAQKAMLDTLLDISVLDAGIAKKAEDTFALTEVVNHLLVDFRDVAYRKNIKLTNRLDDRLHVRSDRTMLGRILSNFIDNALRFTEQGEILIEGREDGDNYVISVRDSGIGIEPEHLDLIWNEFHQVGNAQRWRQNGLGLGLSVVRRLAAILGHRVWVNSKKGEGSTFSVSVPFIHAPAYAPPVAPVTEQNRAPPFMVFVDDDPLVRETFSLVLEDLGFRMIVAESTGDALGQLADEQQPEIMILDYRLQGETGIDTARAIRNRFKHNIPAILLTGDLGQSVQHVAVSNGMRLLHKPVSVPELSSMISEVRMAA